MLVYRVMETSVVSDEVLEKLINEGVQAGWFLDGIHFVTRESSHRPSMAFVTFIRERENIAAQEVDCP
ncbi:MAG: DUF4177 domain-containing protein [Candidatus Tectomicrobia bacterium]|uniref:DUF4177 domain-containing protein n=1 Tax=Tectimicrobiota bacterium TaxID=2528274 RepID=A0A932GQ95_UNCTE|nr:DUF4177 domain-containing protein [Candidatus Tectomicrobia bacterium]